MRLPRDYDDWRLRGPDEPPELCDRCDDEHCTCAQDAADEIGDHKLHLMREGGNLMSNWRYMIDRARRMTAIEWAEGIVIMTIIIAWTVTALAAGEGM